MLKIEKFTDEDGKPRLRIRGGNGEILLSGEAYESKQARDDTMNLLLFSIRDHEYEVVEAE